MVRRKKRKSPFRHKVSSHTRRSPKGKTVKVTEYWRGKGKKPIINLKRKSRKFSSNSLFVVEIHYPDMPSEQVLVKANNYFTALEEGLAKRKRFVPPSIVDVRRRKP